MRDGTDDDGPAVDRSRFDVHGFWVSPPHDWEGEPEDRLLSGELRRVLDDAIALLPAAQQEVITLRDIEGWPAAEVCTVLTITDTHQRVLLHRARSHVRRAVEAYLDVGVTP